MCLSVPAQVVSIDQSTAVVNVRGAQQTVNIMLTPDVQIDEYVLIHVGYALQKIDLDEAQKTLALFKELENT